MQGFSFIQYNSYYAFCFFFGAAFLAAGFDLLFFKAASNAALRFANVGLPVTITSFTKNTGISFTPRLRPSFISSRKHH